jgi:beta-RFAP synthase
VHGFDQGGFLVEGGKAADTAIAPLLIRRAFPADWQILLVTPRTLQGAHGRREIDAFAALAKQVPDDSTTETLCRLVLLGLLPALAEADLPTFGEALYDFNRRVGTLFQPEQRGPYVSPRVEELVKALRDRGVKGVGQSSWGPTIFAVVAASETAVIRDWLMRHHAVAQEEMQLALAWNQPARID